jgi:catechol 2,3-dioxygenase-like lactoylglutathione lyase family enzyme
MAIADGQITFLPCADLARSRAFYGDVLGLELVLDQGTCNIFRVTGNSFIGVCEHLDPIEGRSAIFTIVADDVDGWCKRISDNGGRVESGPAHSDRYHIYHAFIRDPDGNYIEIQRFDDPGWAAPKGS